MLRPGSVSIRSGAFFLPIPPCLAGFSHPPPARPMRRGYFNHHESRQDRIGQNVRNRRRQKKDDDENRQGRTPCQRPTRLPLPKRQHKQGSGNSCAHQFDHHALSGGRAPPRSPKDAPNEVYFGRHAANAKPRIETRPKANHSTPCAAPRMCIAGRAGAKVKVRLEFLEGRLHFPILKVERI